MSEERQRAFVVFRTGPKKGTRAELASEKTMLDEEVSIEYVNGVYLLRSLTDEGVNVSGETVVERILEDGDVIKVSGEEIAFEMGGEEVHVEEKKEHGISAKALRVPLRMHEARRKIEAEKKGGDDGKKKRIRLYLITAFVVLLVFVVLKTEQKKRGEMEHRVEGVRKEQVAKEDEGSSVVGAPKEDEVEDKAEKVTVPVVKKTGSVKRITDEEMVRLLKNARVRFEIAQSFYDQVELDGANLYMAIEHWLVVKNMFEGITPPPQIYVETLKSLEEALERQDEMAKYLMNNAFVAIQSGQKGEARTILLELMNMIQNPVDSYYQKAKKHLIDLE